MKTGHKNSRSGVESTSSGEHPESVAELHCIQWFTKH